MITTNHDWFFPMENHNWLLEFRVSYFGFLHNFLFRLPFMPSPVFQVGVECLVLSPTGPAKCTESFVFFFFRNMTWFLTFHIHSKLLLCGRMNWHIEGQVFFPCICSILKFHRFGSAVVQLDMEKQVVIHQPNLNPNFSTRSKNGLTCDSILFWWVHPTHFLIIIFLVKKIRTLLV